MSQPRRDGGGLLWLILFIAFPPILGIVILIGLIQALLDDPVRVVVPFVLILSVLLLLVGIGIAVSESRNSYGDARPSTTSVASCS